MTKKDGLMAIAVFVLLAMVTSGCSFTHTVTSRKKITAASQAPGDRVKFVYKETSPDKENKQGLIECSVADDGSLTDCNLLEIAFGEGGQDE